MLKITYGRFSNLYFFYLRKESDDVRRINFDDSEEDKVNEKSERFVMVEVYISVEDSKVDIDGRSFRYNLRSNISASKIKSHSKLRLLAYASVVVGNWRIGGKSCMSKSYRDEDGDYASEEFGISDLDDNDNEMLPKYEKFIGDFLNKYHAFKTIHYLNLKMIL